MKESCRRGILIGRKVFFNNFSTVPTVSFLCTKLVCFVNMNLSSAAQHAHDAELCADWVCEIEGVSCETLCVTFELWSCLTAVARHGRI